MDALFLLVAQAILLAVLIAGVIQWRRGMRQRNRRMIVTGAVMTLIAAALTAVAIWSLANEMAIEWNPRIASNDEIRGTWSDGAGTLILGEGNSATYNSAQNTLSGEWYREDWNLFLLGPGLDRRMRFYRKWGRLRLLTGDPRGDPDTWDSNAGWKRK